MNKKYLSIYLNDHLAGAKAGTALARRIAGAHEGTSTGELFSELAGEIDEDRKVLRRVMEGLGVRKALLKRPIAAAGEKLARLKPNGKVVGRSPLSSLIEMEALSLGVAGKRLLWLSLASSSAEVEGVDYGEMVKRTESQRDRIEGEREKAAQGAFASPGSSTQGSPEPATARR